MAQVSLGWMAYSSGGKGVHVGAWVAVAVIVGVSVTVGLAVAVPATDKALSSSSPTGCGRKTK